jgi:putative acetyltransferase
MSQTHPQDISVRIAQPKDRNQIFQIQIDAIQVICSHDYNTEQIAALLDDKQLQYSVGNEWGEIVFVAEIEDTIVGFSALLRHRVSAVYVHPHYVRRGIGRQLLTALEREAVSRHIKRLAVMASLTAQPFYQACGYQIVGECSLISDHGVYVPCIDMEKCLASTFDKKKLVSYWIKMFLMSSQWLMSGKNIKL